MVLPLEIQHSTDRSGFMYALNSEGTPPFIVFSSLPKDTLSLLLDREAERERECTQERNIEVKERHRLVVFLYAP